MRLTPRQQKVLSTTVAFCDIRYEPTEDDIEAFFAYTDRGIDGPPRGVDSGYTLRTAWKFWIATTSKQDAQKWGRGYSMTQRAWLDDHFADRYEDSTSLATVAVDFVWDALTPEYRCGRSVEDYWLRNLPAYQHLCQLRARIGSGAHEQLFWHGRTPDATP